MISTGTGRDDDFFQTTFSSVPTSSELAEGLSTSAPTSRGISIVMNFECPWQNLKWIHLVRSSKGKIRSDGYLLSYFWSAIWCTYFVFRFCTSNFYTDDGCDYMQKWNNSLLLQVTSGLCIHCFGRTVGFLTRNYNQDFSQYWIGASVLKR